MCKDCLTIVMILGFAGILTAVFAGLVSGVTGNLFFKSYLVLFEVFFPFFLFLIWSNMNFAFAGPLHSLFSWSETFLLLCVLLSET